MRTSVDITDAEWLIMRALWDHGTATASGITAHVRRERDVSAQTVKTLLRRLVDKHAAAYDVDPGDSRVYHYRPLIDKDEAVRHRSEAFVSQVYEKNAGDLLAHFVENGGLSEEELLRLRDLVKSKLDGK